MNNPDLTVLGKRVAELRIARQLKQTELAYEAGVSHRTLQRLEAGEVVKTDGLIKVIKCLQQLDAVLAALDSSGFSPYEKLSNAGLKVSQLKKQRNALGQSDAEPPVPPASGRKRRVRRSEGLESLPGPAAQQNHRTVKVQWPEDQE
jgi:transcriptional regulator with XRE-family HTH domain